MFTQFKIPIFKDERGSLGVIEKIIPFEIKRVYFISNARGERGGHRHKKTRQAMVCIKGSVEIYMNNGLKSETIKLINPENCLIIEPSDWHTMKNFSNDCVIMVLASEHFSKDDYIHEAY